MTPLEDLRKIRTELAESLHRADTDLLAGKKPMLSIYDRAERTALLQRIDADIRKLDGH